MKNNKFLFINASILIIIILSLLLVSCGPEPTSQYTYLQPENVDDGLDVGTLEDANIDPNLIGTVVDKIRDGKYKEVHSLLILKDNKLVFEEYFPGHQFKWDRANYHGALVNWNRNLAHTVMSVGKSFTSASIGIAIEEGFIESVDQSIFDYLPEHQHLKTDGKEEITIEHLLTMTSGLEWSEWNATYTDPNNDLFNLWIACDDQITCVLEAPLKKEPGTHFTYNGGSMILLGEILKNATNMNIEDFSAEYLFEPLGINPPVWNKFESGAIDSSGDFDITPRDMTKFGVTYLNEGVWDGEQIFSEEWVDNSTTTYPGSTKIRIPGTDAGRNGYATTWWTKQYTHSGNKIDLFYAGGWGGQYIMVFPEMNTVVVFTGGNYTSNTTAFSILEKYVLPAID